MIITNKLGLPAPLVQAVCNDPYDSGDCDISVTRLIKPPRAVVLAKRHRDEIEVDVSQRIYALMGQLGHAILERAGDTNQNIIEKRYFAAHMGWTISGQVDLIQNDTGNDLIDYKYTSKWSVKDGLKPEWEQQLNINRWLAESNGVTVNSLAIVSILRDWSAPGAARGDCPPEPVQVWPAPIWPREHLMRYLDERVRLHQEADALPDDALPECSSEERWAREPKFAVMVRGRKRALKLHDDYDAALAHAASEKGGYVEERPGESMMCRYYCDAWKFCPLGRAERGENS